MYVISLCRNMHTRLPVGTVAAVYITTHTFAYVPSQVVYNRYISHSKYKELKYRELVVPVDLINQSIGINESPETIAKLLTQMCLRTAVTDDMKSVVVEVPPTRHGKWKNTNLTVSNSMYLCLWYKSPISSFILGIDVIHPCDVVEDVAIAYGFNKVERTFPKTNCTAQQVCASFK